MESIWIDAVDFKDYGGFVKETQFVREMGQPYLLADGVGTPIQPASTSFKVTEDGYYRFHIRTKNWCPEYNPDGLVIEVDGVKSEYVCSNTHTFNWKFEAAGDFNLTKGEHILKVYDTKGWFGRFAAVIITNDYDFTPSPEINRLLETRNKIKGISKTVKDEGKFDLIVAGGGVAGVTTAITAARKEIKVALINDRPVLGGNGSIEGNVALEGSAHTGWHETGVIFEIKAVRETEGITWSEAFERFVKAEKNITLYLNTLVFDAETENDEITCIKAKNTNDLTEHKFTADYFADGTGDAWLGYYAGAAYRVGREAKFQHNEDFAPKVADSNTMSGCNTRTVNYISDTVCGYSAEILDEKVDYVAPDWAFKLPEGDKLGRTPNFLDKGNWWLEMPNDYDDIWESEYVRDSMLRLSAGYFDWLKNSWKDREKVANYKLKALGTYNAKRESRRLIGDYILTENDYEKTKFSDAVCYCGWNIDVHHVGGLFSGADGLFSLNRKINISPIPLRCLYSKNIKNLFMVGRCISVTHIGLGPVRVMLTGGVMGQAVATAVSLCKKYSLKPACFTKEIIGELQQTLIKDGMYIPGVLSNDKDDLAKKAVITADSFTENGNPENVVNGKTRKKESDNYAWISQGDLPQSLTFTFKEKVKINEIRITFDIPFDKFTYGWKPTPVFSGLVSDFSVEVFKDGNWETIYENNNNIQRLVVITANAVVTDKVRITVNKAIDFTKAIIPEVRIY